MMKKTNIAKLLFIFTLIGAASSSATYAYLKDNKSVFNSVQASLGNISCDFILNDNVNTGTSLINITGLIPGKSEIRTIKIKNTGSLTEKISLNMNKFTESNQGKLLQYIDYKIEVGNNSYTGKLKDLASSPNTQFNLKDKSGNAIYLAPGETLDVKITFTLSMDAYYSSQNQSISFSMNITGTQPNDSNWVY